MANVDSFDGAKTKMVEWFESHLLSYVNQAKRTINELNKTSRAGVSAYMTQLWCWQRLTKRRKEISNILSKEWDGITVGRPNVDHCVSHAFWEDFLSNSPEFPKGSDVYNDMMAKINQIGNCNILCKRVNCSKSAATMCKFCDEVGLAYSDIEALYIPEEMFSPDKNGLSPEKVMCKIEERTKLIRKELCGFLDGEEEIFIHR